MKKFAVVFATACVVLLNAGNVDAALRAIDEDNKVQGIPIGIRGRFGSISDNTLYSQGERCQDYVPGDFLAADPTGGTILTPAIHGTTTPGLFFIGNKVALRWFDNETSPAQLRFRVESGYVSGGTFRAFVGRSGSDGTPPAIDYQVFVDKDETAFDAAATDQTAVQLTTNITDGSPEELALAVTTDFDSLASGDWVTAEFWRDNVNTSTDNLHLLGLQFCGEFWE